MRKLILITLIGLLIMGCKEDLYEEQPNNPLKGKIKLIQHYNGSIVADSRLLYDTSNGQLESIILNDSIVYMELKELNENSLLLTFERFSLLVGINEDRVNYIEPYSIEDSSFVFSNQYSYGVNNKLDTILIDGENCIDFVVFEQCFWGGKVMQFHFTENYLSSCYQYLYSYEDGFGVESEIVKDTFLFEYTNLSNDEPLPQQMPYAVFSVKNDAAGVFPIAYFDYLHYLLRLAGYKIFEDNKNLKLSENDTDFKYQFNDKGQVIEMEVSYGSNGGQYPTQINTYNFEYYD